LRVYEKLVGNDLNLGQSTGIVVTNPGGGTIIGTQISLTTFSLAGADGSAPTLAWSPASVPAGQSVTTTLTVVGAQLGDKVDVWANISLSGCQLTGYVSAANTITIVLANPTTAAVALGALTLTCLVSRVR
jgi:hypothetical protein